MAIKWSDEPKPVVVPKRQVVTGVECDACGGDAMHRGHRRAHAVLNRIQDDGRGNMEIWELDLCERCKDQVKKLLSSIAYQNDRELPQQRVDVHQ